MFDWLSSLWKNPARDWVILFLALQGLILIDGATNTYSRWTTLVSITEDKTVRTDRYYPHTVDWARTSDGHYYSNKAPGPMLIGFPVFWALDYDVTHNFENRIERDKARLKARNLVMQRLSYVTQVIPYAAVVLLLIHTLQKRGVSLAALHFTTAALLFGNTASLFMNTYFGHALSAVFVLTTSYVLFRRHYLLTGLYFGLSCLCDYGATLLLLPILIVLFGEAGSRLKRFVWFGVGGFIPGIVWTVYHTYCFGGPFSLPNKYQNPLFVDVPKDVPQLWGILRLYPDPTILKELLVGPARGLLYTQGWVLLTFVGLLYVLLFIEKNKHFPHHDRLLRESTILSFGGLALLLVMNCSFNGWHGGATPGPRYLSIVLPVCAIPAGLLFSRLPSVIRQAMVVFLALSIVLFILVYGTRNLLTPETELFTAYLRNLLVANGEDLQRILYLTLAFGWVTYRAFHSVTKESGTILIGPGQTL
jgi:hypothetical protein